MEELYVKTSKKARVDKVLYTKEQVTSPDFTSDYGRIVPPGYVVFDFDAQPYINIIYKILVNSKYKCRMLKTTKGYHFMFKTTLNKCSDAIGLYSWLGLKCDIKGCGTKDKKQSYQSLRVDGVTREEVLINTDDWDDIDYAPRWMYVVSNKKKDQIDLTEDQSGGRNNLFHSELMIRAKKAGFSYDEYVEMAYIINDYVLPKGLDEEELNTAIRPEEWDNLQLGEDKIILEQQAQDVIQYWNCVLGGDNFGYFNPELDRYATDLYPIKYYLQQKYAANNITTSKMEEVMEQVDLILHSSDKYKYERNREYILCGKELVSTWKDEVKPNTRTVYTDVYYPYSIMSQEEFDNYNGRMKSFMDEISVGNPETLTLIWEMIGCMLAPEKPFGKIFVLYGSGANGKSVLLRFVAEIMGPLITYGNILAINDKFALEGVINGIANVTDDVGITTLKETGILKNLIDGGKIEVHRKFKDPIWWQPNSQFVMCCNEIPRIQDTTNGMARRLSFIPFELQLPDGAVDRTLFSKMISDPNNLRYLMTGGIFAYRKAFKRGDLYKTDKQKELLSDFIEENEEPIKTFYNTLLEEHKNMEALARWINGKTTDEVYSMYKKWCESSAIQPELSKTFTRQFSKLLPSNVKKKVLSIGGAKFNSYVLEQVVKK